MNMGTVLVLIQWYQIYKRKHQPEYMILHWLEKRKKRISYIYTGHKVIQINKTGKL